MQKTISFIIEGHNECQGIGHITHHSFTRKIAVEKLGVAVVIMLHAPHFIAVGHAYLIRDEGRGGPILE